MTTADLRIPRDLYTALKTHVTQAQESAGYLLCGMIEDGERLVLLGREWWPVRPRYRLISSHGMAWHPNFDVAMLNRAQKEQTKGSESVLGAMENIKRVADLQHTSMRELERSIDQLAEQSEVLRSEVRRFRV